jgi:hypothetical protein
MRNVQTKRVAIEFGGMTNFTGAGEARGFTSFLPEGRFKSGLPVFLKRYCNVIPKGGEDGAN